MSLGIDSLSLLLFFLHGTLILIASARVLMTSELRSPTQSLAWILSFFLLPVLSVSFYAFLGYRGFRRRRRLKRPWAYLTKPTPVKPQRGPAASYPFYPTFVLASDLANRPIRELTHTRLYHHSFESYGAIADAIRRAQSTVDLLYYIYQPDETGLEIRSLLIDAAKRGVKCRLLLDSVGSYRISSDFLHPLQNAGVLVQFFEPVRFGRLWSFHYRNHRKIAVIDGNVGFLGSQNIGNEYLGWKRSRRPWKDLSLELRGSLVSDLQGVFDADWRLTTEGPEAHQAPALPAEDHAFAPVQPAVILPTGPDEKEHALEMVICDLLARSAEEVTLVTPYFVPSLPVRMALQSAAKRKVRTRILLPDQSDQWVVDLATRLFAEEMRKNGIEVYFHSREFLHAKLLVVDRQVGLIGSANMDERSFRLNWEVSALISSSSALEEMTTLVEGLFRDSHEGESRKKEHGIVRKMGEGVVRILTPLL